MLRWSYNDASIGYVSFFAALKIDGTWQCFVAVERTTGDARNLLMIDNGLAILDDGDGSPEKRDVQGLPFSWLSGQFGGRSQKAVDTACVVAGRLRNRVGLDLDFVTAAKIDTAVVIDSAVEFNMQLEILEPGVVDQLRAIARRYQVAVFDFPYG